MELKPNRWEQVKILFDATLQQKPEARTHFLEAICSDPEIRREVYRLIANHNEMGSFLSDGRESASLQRLRSPSHAFVAGQLLADRFEVTCFIARGGMGEVYEAWDLELQMSVAVKAIRPDLLGNSNSLERFKKEVQLSRQVTHPNVCRVHDFFRHSNENGPPIFIISMEYLRGETLAERLRRVARMNTREALPLVLQITSALEAAHNAGILHRDLKPENIMLVPGEQGVRAVVMDFGVALRAEGPLTDLTSTMLTGTPAYMSPEQLESGDLTPASDIYSLGLVIYRMVTGRQAFRDITTTSAVLQRLSEAPPSPCELVSDLNHSWEIVIVRCLEREPSRRYPSARSVGEALDRQGSAFPLGHPPGFNVRTITDEPISDSAVPAGIIKRHKWAVVGTSSAVVVLAAAGALVLLLQILRLPAKVPAELTQERLTFNSSDRPVSSFALSADAEYLAYADLAGIHVKLLPTGEERLIPKPKRASANASWEIASWFPDRTRLLAHLGVPVLDEAGGPGSTWAVSVLGQSPQQLRERAWGWEVSPDGARIAFSPLRSSTGDAREIWVMDNRGSNPRKVLAAEGNEWLGTVRWSPDGRRLAYLRAQRSSSNSDTNSVETCDLNGANCAVVVPPEVGHWHTDFSWLPDGRIIYAREESGAAIAEDLWQRGIDSRSGKPTGEPKRITHWAESVLVGLSASSDGKHLAVLKQTDQRQIEVGELTANGTHINAPERLTNEEAFGYPSDWTSDGKAVLLTYNHNGQTNIYKQPIAQQAAGPIATGPFDAYLPHVSPDGEWIIYMAAPRTSPYAPQRLMRVPVNGGVPEFVLEARNWIDHSCGHAPAGCVVIERSQDRKWRNITAFDPLKGRGKLLRTIPEDAPNGNCCRPAEVLSADGLTYAVARNVGDATRIQLLSLSNSPDREIVVNGWMNMTGLDWAPDDKGLYCGSFSPHGRTLLYVNLTGTAQILRHYKGMGDGNIWGVPSPDGRHIAILGGTVSSNVWMLEGF